MSVNQSTDRKTAIPSLQSSFRKQQTSTEDETSASTSSDIKANKTTNQAKSDSDESDDGTMGRPSFALNPTKCEPNVKPSHQNQNIAQVQSQQPKKLTRIPDTGFIVYETLAQTGQQSINILQMSAAKQGAIVKSDVEVSKTEPNSLECVVRINDRVYGSASVSAGKKEAKIQAFDKALEYARKIHYTIKVNICILMFFVAFSNQFV